MISADIAAEKETESRETGFPFLYFQKLFSNLLLLMCGQVSVYFLRIASLIPSTAANSTAAEGQMIHVRCHSIVWKLQPR